MSRSSTHFLFHYWDGHNLRDAFMEPWKGLTNVLGNERVNDGRVNLAFKTLGLNGFFCFSPVNHATILVTRKYLERTIFYLVAASEALNFISLINGSKCSSKMKIYIIFRLSLLYWRTPFIVRLCSAITEHRAARSSHFTFAHCQPSRSSSECYSSWQKFENKLPIAGRTFPNFFVASKGK